MSNNFLEYLNSTRFFSPSEELIVELARRIDVEKQNDFRKSMGEVEDPAFSMNDARMSHDRKIHGIRGKQKFLRPETASELVGTEYLSQSEGKSYLGRGRGNRTPKPVSFEITATDTTELRRFVSKQIYQLLASIARDEEAMDGNNLSINEIFHEEDFGPEVLGLPEDEPLLNELTDQFIAWIKQEGECVTGWGKIIYCEEDKIYLHSLYDW